MCPKPKTAIAHTEGVHKFEREHIFVNGENLILKPC